ncbi:MAG: hypothetical protein F4171_10280 [Gammaproteobacteria bacterium]|nr:hypothetical protein [Gammaproteobacteria bacterium]
MPPNKRQKASDVFRDTNFFIAKKSDFDAAFPEIANLSGTVEEDGDGVSSRLRVRHLGKDTGEYFDCSNPLCYNGGFSLGNLLRSMVGSRATHKQDTLFCQGYEGSPKGRRRYRDCMNSFRIAIDIEYRDPE